jgi:hypothetical protein
MISSYPTRNRIPSLLTGLLVLVLLLTLTAVTAGAQLWTGVKLVVHLQPVGGSGPCPASSFSLGCNGNSSVVVNGDLNTDYYALIVATNVDPAVGLSGAAFGIYYNYLQASGLSVSSWTSCADAQVAGPDWPDPGSSIELGFTGCRGTTPDPADTAGAGIVVLGTLQVSATSQDNLFIVRRFDVQNDPVTVTDCASQVTLVDAISNCGQAGFGTSGIDPCEVIADRFPTACCLTEGCQGLDPIYCDYLGGVPLFDPVQQVNCDPSACVAPVESTTWGRIKAIYR